MRYILLCFLLAGCCGGKSRSKAKYHYGQVVFFTPPDFYKEACEHKGTILKTWGDSYLIVTDCKTHGVVETKKFWIPEDQINKGSSL